MRENFNPTSPLCLSPQIKTMGNDVLLNVNQCAELLASRTVGGQVIGGATERNPGVLRLLVESLSDSNWNFISRFLPFVKSLRFLTILKKRSYHPGGFIIMMELRTGWNSGDE